MKTIAILFITTFISFTTFAQSTKSKTQITKHVSKATFLKYTCAMHPDIVSSKPGKCPKCGMNLTVIKKNGLSQETKTYTCLMHPEVVSDKPGKCAKCNMDLTEVSAKENRSKDSLINR